jgi:hypothetical protein
LKWRVRILVLNNELNIFVKGVERMRVCEICGAKEKVEKKENEEIVPVILHVCETCREDRKWSHYDNWVF